MGTYCERKQINYEQEKTKARAEAKRQRQEKADSNLRPWQRDRPQRRYASCSERASESLRKTTNN